MPNHFQNGMQQAFAAALAGVASHLFYFKQGEHHLHAPVLFYSLLAFPYLILSFEEVFNDTSLIEATLLSASVVFSYLGALFGSIFLYRILFHPLQAFPGPFWAKVSKIWHVYHTRDSQNHLFLDKLHREYGAFVRTGPSEVTVFDPEAIPAVDGPGNTCVKAPWYDLLYPLKSVIIVRDKQAHDVRRKIWDPAFTPRALRDYDLRITSHCRKLEKHFASKQGEPVRVNECCAWLALDVIGDMAFGKSFGLLDGGEMIGALTRMKTFMGLFGPFSPTPWLCRLAFAVPGLTTGWSDFIAWCAERMTQRLEVSENCDNPDVLSRIIQYSRERDTVDQDRPWLDGDALTMLIAGSDSVANTTTCVLYELARRRNYQETLREDLQAIQDLSDLHALSNVPSLNSFISETLRFHPVVPTGGIRKAGPGGLSIGGHFIPPWTTIVVPRWTIGRLESAFAQADEFIPERWTTKPELVHRSYAHSPFGTGRYRCVGKNLALREISFVVALLLRSFDIEFAPGEDGSRINKDRKDLFSAMPGALDLVFRKRGEESRGDGEEIGREGGSGMG